MAFRVFDSAQDVIVALAEEFLNYSEQGEAIHISLSGGSTPSRLFRYLASTEYATGIQWSNLHFWWGDERCVAISDTESNYGEAKALLFDHIQIPVKNIHRIRGELSPAEAAQVFSDDMADVLLRNEGSTVEKPTAERPITDRPVYDWVLLGVGEDGHTASLFPGQTDMQATDDCVIASHPETKQLRISITAPVIANAKRVSYLVLGVSKAPIVEAIYMEKYESNSTSKFYPAAQICSALGATEWYLDSAAAERINEKVVNASVVNSRMVKATKEK